MNKQAALPVTRAIDHLVMPVAGLAAARARLTKLGFTVAPDARHPFGTANACVYLGDGTYLEPLAVAHRETAEKAALAGNAFVARDAAFRFRRGPNGFSAIAFASADAAADHRHFVKAGISGGKVLRFARTFDDGKGNVSKAEFETALAADLRAPDAFFLATRRVLAPKVDRSALQRHANGATGLREVFGYEANPTDFQYLIQELTGNRDVNAHSFGMEIRATNANVAVYDAAGLKAWFGAKTGHAGRGLRLCGAVIAVASLREAKKLLRKNRVEFAEIAGRIVVSPAEGQGAILAFEEAK
jgi:hypothetical protein